jgi:4-oxalocrotonate tautomerase
MDERSDWDKPGHEAKRGSSCFNIIGMRVNRRTVMPVVTVQMWTGRTPAQKKALVRAITDAMVEHAGAKPTHLHVILQEVPKENWALAGVLGDERKDI